MSASGDREKGRAQDALPFPATGATEGESMPQRKVANSVELPSMPYKATV